MQLGEKKLIVQRASVGAKGGLPPEVSMLWQLHILLLYATGID